MAAMANTAAQQEKVSFGADGDLAEKHQLYMLRQKHDVRKHRKSNQLQISYSGYVLVCKKHKIQLGSGCHADMKDL